MAVEMHLTDVRVELPTNTPVVLLREATGRRTLAIYIGTNEANAINQAMRGIEPPRPLTHDLLRDVIVALGATVERVVITELRDQTYFAELSLLIEGRACIVSSRPSDAIALAVRTGAPMYAEESVLDEAAQVLPDEDERAEGEDVDQLVSQFREFIEGVQPDDFE